jgi:hypothetical protein
VPMAKARQQAEWMRTGVSVSWMKGVSPWKVIPRSYHPDFGELTPEQEAIDSERSWAALDHYMMNLGNQNGGAGR